MKFSVLLPTRNRLDLLKYAVETVLRQDYDDWEIVISDNFSEDDIAGYARSLNEPRVKYCRTDSFVPVTHNWNNALKHCTGDYVIMLGDDDCLMKGYFSTLRHLIDTYDHPDFIYTSAFLYAYPGVMPGFPEGFLQTYGYADFLKSATGPFFLDSERAIELVRQSMGFKVLFGYNMQFAVISRQLITELQRQGEFFQSPYPDYYAMNAMLLKGKRILVFPKPMVTIGISPKSFGYFYYNESEQSGVEFLRNLPDKEIAGKVQHVVLPGTNMNTSWLLAMETLKQHYGAAFHLAVRYKRYRRLQMLHVFRKYFADKEAAGPELIQLRQSLHGYEKVVYGCLRAALMSVGNTLAKKAIRLLLAVLGTYPRFKPQTIAGKFCNVLDVFNTVQPHDYR